MMQLLHKRLDDSAGAEQQAEAQVEMQELLAGRVLTTLHQPKMAYRFRGISGATIGDKFPDDRCALVTPRTASPAACNHRWPTPGSRIM